MFLASWTAMRNIPPSAPLAHHRAPNEPRASVRVELAGPHLAPGPTSRCSRRGASSTGPLDGLLVTAPRLDWRGMTESTAPGVFVERLLDYKAGDAPPRTVTVRIYQPLQRGPHEWQARVVISGMDDELDHEFAGVDGVQALFEALSMAGAHLDRHPGLSHGKYKPWEPVGFLAPADRLL